MRAFIDNKLIEKIAIGENPKEVEAFLETCAKEGILTDGQLVQVSFGWPSLFEYIQQGGVLTTFPQFGDDHPLFALLMAVLTANPERDVVIRLYDQIFVECLTQVKALPQIHPAFLLEMIRQRRHKILSLQIKHIFSSSVEHYEKYLSEDPYNAIHDLTLYLAWDRVCIYLAIVFENMTPGLKIREGLDVLKECLIESFQHITAHGRTAPSFFRLMEALYAYYMRDEQLQSYNESDWAILCQGSQALKPRENLSDVFYIDAAIVSERELKHSQKGKDFFTVLTLDSVEKVSSTLSLAQFMINQLKKEEKGWLYTLCPVEIVCLEEIDGTFSVVDTIVSA